MKALEQALNAFWFVLGCGVCVHARQLGVWGPSGPDSGFFPLLAGAAIVATGIALLARTARRAPVAPHFWPSRAAGWRVSMVVAGLAAVIVLIPLLGFLLSGAIVTAFLLRALERNAWWIVLAISLGSTAAVYWLFVRLLGTALPRGPLGF
jgi:putative tricarboxylic transport membrane protein